MKLKDVTESYVAARRSSGASFKSGELILRHFLRRVGDVPLAEITPAMCRAFYDLLPRTPTCRARYGALRGLFAFATARGSLRASPLPDRAPRAPSTFQPYIYTHDELRRLLDATRALRHSHSPLQAATFRTLLLLLYAAGLRASEGLRLTLADVDLEAGSLCVRDSKFFTSRNVPIHSGLQATLLGYRSQRSKLAEPKGSSSAFFATRTGRAVSLSRLERVFRKLRRAAGLLLPGVGARAQPRLHDLRHTFAVHRLLAWYREGANVQQRLPWLSKYLGHRTLQGTQVYLSLTPALLDAASARFAAYAQVGTEAPHG